MSEDTTTVSRPVVAGGTRAAPGGEPGSRGAALLGGLLSASRRSTGVIIGLVLLCLYMAVTEPVFLTWGNITNVIASNTVVLILAVGATLVIISGGIDLSTASAAALTGMTFGLLLQGGHGFLVALLGTLVVGLLLGFVNGVLIAYVKVSFLVVTLGTLSVFESLALVVNDGGTVNAFSLPGFAPINDLTSGEVAGIPYLLLLDAVIVVVAALVLRYTTFGRAVYAIGSNPEAARLNGVDVARTTLSVYVLAGLFAALASLVQVGRLTGASPNIDSTLLLTVIAAVLIGGTAYTGGEGGVGGTVLGVLFLGVIQNCLTLSDVSSFWRGTVNGVVLVAAVTLGVARDRGWLSVSRGRVGAR
jgi:ribose/xylose/arabinose/galactoside ABC-type transport system permease subunit